MQRTLEGHVALVTGSGRGLGHAIANTLAAQGAAVAIHDISEEAPARYGEHPNLSAVAADLARHNVASIGVVGDIADEAAVNALVARAQAALGPLTILVNCAGGDIGVAGGKPVPNDALGIPIADVRAILDRNLIGTMLLCRAVCPGMAERKRGSVINIASLAAHIGAPSEVAYACAKAAVVHYTRCLASEMRTAGVRVNAVSPGPTKTARFLATRVTDPDMMAEGTSLERYGVPSEIADVVAFLASDASRFMNGQVLRVDGGMTLFPG